MKIELGRVEEGFIRTPKEPYIEGDCGKQLEFSESIIPREKRSRWSDIRWLKMPAAAVVLTAELAYLGYMTGTIIADRFSDDNVLTPPDERQGLNGIVDLYGLDHGEGIDDFDKAVLIDQYKLAKSAFVQYGNYEIVTDYSSDTIVFIKEGRRSLLIDGANLVNKMAGDKPFQIDEDKDSIKYASQEFEFKLGDTYSEFLLGGVIDQMLEIDNAKNPISVQEEAISNLKDLIWLSSHKLPIEFRSDSYSFPDTQILINMSRFYQTITELGYPIPSHIVFGQHSRKDIGAGWYVRETDTVIVTSRAGESAEIHEEAHHQADENTEFSQEKFNQIFLDAIGKTGADYKQKDFYVSDYPLTKNSQGETLTEEYAEVIEAYFTDGVGFRHQLKLLYETSNPAFEVKKAQYEFAQEFFGGKQYLINGEIFTSEHGSVFTIDDPDPNQTSGIYLREEPKVGDENGRPKIFDQELVRVLDGPREMTFSSGETVSAWKVELVYKEGDNYNSTGLEGWIWDIWLGDRIMKY